MASVVVSPVAAFHDQAHAFEAALAACVGDPKPKNVHVLRTTTRRLEGLLQLLCALKGLPKHKRASERLLKQLGKLRRRAGELRDIDVGAKLLEKHLPPDAIYSGQINHASVELTRHFAKERERLSARLAKFFMKRQAKILMTLHKAAASLEDAHGFTLPVAELLALIDKQYLGGHAVGMRDPSVEQLHSIRKAAKRARYTAELSAAPEAVHAATQYGALQHEGGVWHDWHSLSAVTTSLLGEDHPISGAFAHLTDRQLTLFRTALEAHRRGSHAA